MEAAATVFPDPIPLPAFELHDQTGTSFTKENLKGHWSFLFFGYTHCPDTCPVTLTVLKQVDKRLLETSDVSRPEIVFVSVDPERDTDEERADYVAGFNPAFISVTGPQEQLSALSKPIGIAYQRENGATADENYKVDHSTVILLIDHRARLRALISPPYDAGVIARDYKKIISASVEKDK